MYQSEFTQFINDYLMHHPHIDAERRVLRQTWWDREVDWDDQSRWQASRVPQKGYVYQPD